MNRSRREIDPAATRRAILGSATRVFAERGYAGASYQLIADEAGLQKSHIQYHFGTKEDLWQTVVDYVTREFTIEFERLLSEGSPSFEQVIRARHKVLSGHPEYVRLLGWMCLDGAPIPATMQDRTRQFLNFVMGMPMEEDGPDVPREHLFAIAFGALHGYFLFRRLVEVEGAPAMDLSESAYLESLLKVLFSKTEVKSVA
jgi:TetR/AcrR family transcriptional regulator